MEGKYGPPMTRISVAGGPGISPGIDRDGKCEGGRAGHDTLGYRSTALTGFLGVLSVYQEAA